VTPLRLQLKNFMSYGEGVPPLDLADVRLACLSGDNGNGKSALLDAMTWALFGETRARTEDDVIRLGAKACAVLFDFEVAGVRYRIDKRRDRSRGASWEFQARQDDGSFRSLSGTSARETKEKIQATLRLDYKTFLSTVYLKQGEADAFAKATAGERKDVLARILDLSRYDALEALARERWRDAQGREADADRALTEIDGELERWDETEQRLSEAQTRLTEGEALISAAQQTFEAALARCEALEAEQRRLEDYQVRLREAEEALARDRYDERQSEERLREAERTLSRKAEIEGALARRESLQEELKPLEVRWSQGLTLQNEARRLESIVQEARSALEREAFGLSQEIESLRRESVENGHLEQECRSLDANLSRLSDAEPRRQAAERATREAEAQLATLRAENQALKTEYEKLDRRIQALSSGDAPECEWCGQPLSAAGRRRALEDTEVARAALEARRVELQSEGRAAKQSAEDARARSESALADAREREGLLARHESAQRQLQRLRERTAMLPDRERQRDAVVRELSEGRYAREEQERLGELNIELGALDSIGKEVQRLRHEIDSLREADRDAERLAQAEQVAAAEPERLAVLRAAIEKRRSQIEKGRNLIADLESKTRDLSVLRQERDEAQKSANEARAALAQAERSLGQLQAERERLEKRRDERTAVQEQRERAIREKETYRELTGALGKRGVQALIIENALPEIEEEANRLLERMTQGAMRVRLQTTREAKAKSVSTIETLDIILSDDLGTRPYELYSGGEAFRVNLALRVALSRTLARRAGAPLQTLILDEGFGTQDPRGREAIADALHAISPDFALVLVITHIDDLKESFPTRIDVVKGDSGSTFTLQ
jgi:exonuclease SbcC